MKRWIFWFCIISMSIWASEPPVTLVQQLRKVEQSINRREAYPYLLIHNPPLASALERREDLPKKPEEGYACSDRFCLVCLSKKFPKQRS